MLWLYLFDAVSQWIWNQGSPRNVHSISNEIKRNSLTLFSFSFSFPFHVLVPAMEWSCHTGKKLFLCIIM